MARMRPFSGLTANWMFDPPVSTPISRITLIEASLSSWYSLSVSVCAGATVMLSPVCTPMGSKFSMEQMITTLSARSRMTSSSYSFQPITDSSISTSVMGLVDSPHSTASAYSDSLRAMLPPAPPRVKAGRIIAGNPVFFTSSHASSTVRAKPPRGTSRPMRPMASWNNSRSSAILMASSLAPMSSTPWRSRAPDSASSTATLSAVCPPSVGNSTSGRSRRMIFSTYSAVIGST